MEEVSLVNTERLNALNAMNKLPTDRYVLDCIFKMYESLYPGPKTPSGSRENDPYIAIDLKAVANELGCNPELLFGRLYYHLDQKYRYKKGDGAIVSLFHLQVGDKKHAIQFPLLASILAGMNQDFRRQSITYGLSLTALVVSITSLMFSILKS